jgi:hypothetical protein
VSPFVWSGLKVMVSPHAVATRFFVERAGPPSRRRKRWRVARRLEPCAFEMAGGVLIAHPEVAERLRRATGL